MNSHINLTKALKHLKTSLLELDACRDSLFPDNDDHKIDRDLFKLGLSMECQLTLIEHKLKALAVDVKPKKAVSIKREHYASALNLHKHITGYALLDKNKIFKLSMDLPIITGVYFLILKGTIVYVGQSVNIFQRVGVHASAQKIKFDKYYYLECKAEYLNILESIYIHKIKPPQNGYYFNGLKQAPLSEAELSNLSFC